MIPKYERPALPVADSFPGGGRAAGGAAPRPVQPRAPLRPPRRDVPWQDFFTDARLQVGHRPRAREQPRPQGRDPQRREGRGPLPDPALGAEPDDRRPGDGRQVPDPGEHRQGRQGEHRLDVHRRPRPRLVGARPLRAPPEPEGPRPRAVPRDGGGPARARRPRSSPPSPAAGSTLAADEESLRLSKETLAGAAGRRTT